MDINKNSLPLQELKSDSDFLEKLERYNLWLKISAVIGIIYSVFFIMSIVGIPFGVVQIIASLKIWSGASKAIDLKEAIEEGNSEQFNNSLIKNIAEIKNSYKIITIAGIVSIVLVVVLLFVTFLSFALSL